MDTFSLQVDNAIVTATKFLEKVSRMTKGRFGFPIHVGLNLFKILFRAHMEFGIPVWANLSEKNIQKL